MDPSPWKILLIDPNQQDYLHTQALLSEVSGRQISLDWAASYLAGKRALQAGAYDAALIENNLGTRTGIELVRELAAEECTVPLILYLCCGSYEIDLEALQAGASHYLPKSEASPAVLERSIRYAIERKGFEEELYRANRSLRRSRQDLAHAQAVSHTGSWRLDVHQGQLVWSDETYRMFGIPLGAPLTYEAFLEMIHPDDRAYVDQAWTNALQGEPYDIEHRIVVDGQVKWVREQAVLEFDPSGNLLSGFGAVRDITQSKQAEQALQENQAALRQYAEQLERSNRELEEFAFVASHDLQEPLRKIESFGKLLQAESAGLAPAQRLYIERMSQAARRMSSMVADLLSLARIATQGRPFERVDLGAVAAEILSDLDQQIGRTAGQVEIGPLPVVVGDPSQLRQLFQNLIGNALKYHQPGRPPQVQISATPWPPDQVQIEIRDNGIGFEEIHTERIFQPFQRLVGKGEYEGSGIGLAICRKIVERHGGSITVRSRPGDGSTFIVRLPAALRIDDR